MPVQWSGLGPQLLIELDRVGPTPLRSQLEGQLRGAIQNGRLSAGERLPSSRALADHLGVSRGLIQECYAQLQAEGYLTSRGGSATLVAATMSGPRPSPAPTPAPPTGPGLIADFQSGVPDLGLVPREDWAWAVREACRRAPNSSFDYGDPRGDPRLRDVLAAYLRRVRAVDAHADQVVVCGGFAQGLGIVLRTLARAGLTRVAFEDPGSVGTISAAAVGAGSDAVAVPVDELGIDVDALDVSGARVVVLTPAHQWPTGVVLAAKRRHRLVTWARERDAIVIEDDYDAEFRYDREPVGSLQGLAPDRVVALGTVSKSLAPALRLGWAVAPATIADELAVAKRLADRGTPGLDQLALATLIESGRHDRHLRRMRTEYAARRSALVESLAAHAPDIRLTGLAAGFHAVAHLPEGADEQHIIGQARTRGVGIYGMSTYRSTHDTEPPQLVLGFGNISQRAIRTGMSTIADLLRGRPMTLHHARL
jgi:GntR family transcriptional regulator/MocR family aminotransferase